MKQWFQRTHLPVFLYFFHFFFGPRLFTEFLHVSNDARFLVMISFFFYSWNTILPSFIILEAVLQSFAESD